MEKELIKLIKNTLNSSYIGDDCAYLKDLGIVISQDSLVEDIHFLRDKISPWQLGWKTASVNISDICASGAQPKYMTVALSLPKEINTEFVKEFYDGLKSACDGVEIVGGDITAADKIFISATAIGSDKGRNISSRANAQPGQKIVIAGVHGSSAAGLKLLLEGKSEPMKSSSPPLSASLNREPCVAALSNTPLKSLVNETFSDKLIKAHLEPVAQLEFSRKIATAQTGKYAMMDTSDGLMDALSQISEASGVGIDINFDKIPVDEEIKSFTNWQELVLFGGEDYGLVATVDTPLEGAVIIGEITKGSGVTIDGQLYPKALIDKKIFNHFVTSQ